MYFFNKKNSIVSKETKFAKGGLTSDETIGFIPMDLEADLGIVAKWGGTDIKGVIRILSAMIDSNLTDEDLKAPDTKTLFQREKQTDKKVREIWKKIEPKYKGDFTGNKYYSPIYELVEKATIKNILKRYKPFRKFQKD